MAVSDEHGHSEVDERQDTARRAVDIATAQLRPCLVTSPAQGDDYGFDAYVEQIVRKAGLVHTAKQFAIQSKGTLKSFEGSYWSESIKVRHLLKWEASTLEVLVVVTSVSQQLTRWRFVHDINEELDRTNPGWRDKEPSSRIAIKFRDSDEHLEEGLHSWLEKRLADLLDYHGGKDRPHRTIRSVFITELYHRYAFSGNRGKLAAGSPQGPIHGHFISGLQWLDGEFDTKFLAANRVLTGALLMFDKVFFLSSMAYSAIEALGPKSFLRLIEAKRLIPVTLDRRDLVFLSGSDAPSRGDLYYLDLDTPAIQDRHLKSLRQKYSLSKSFVTTVTEHIRHIELPVVAEQELLEISKSQEIRELLGLGLPRPQAQEGIWSAERLLRIGHVLNFYLIAKQLGVDVVEMEPGLSRIALARWGNRLSFHRVYEVLDVLESALAGCALPDLGTLSRILGLQKCVEIAESSAGSRFRDWFWKNAAEALDQRGAFDKEFVARILELARTEEVLPPEFLVASSESVSGEIEGWASRPGSDASLHRQKQAGETRLRRALRDYKITLPAMNDKCICEASALFEECCGRVLWQTNQDVVDMFYGGKPPTVKR